ncbi:hypothetical protein BHO_0900019 (plasmid) [Borrelia hermsii YBT]|nr:hypothetical protein BHO_0900019 [Borrelia hermsii YBT]
MKMHSLRSAFCFISLLLQLKSNNILEVKYKKMQA